jgi:hypothetical protein
LYFGYGKDWLICIFVVERSRPKSLQLTSKGALHTAGADEEFMAVAGAVIDHLQNITGSSAPLNNGDNAANTNSTDTSNANTNTHPNANVDDIKEQPRTNGVGVTKEQPQMKDLTDKEKLSKNVLDQKEKPKKNGNRLTKKMKKVVMAPVFFQACM